MLCNNCCGLDDEVFQIKCAVWHIIHSYRSWFCCFYWLTVGGVTGRFVRVRTSLWEGKYAVGKQERAKVNPWIVRMSSMSMDMLYLAFSGFIRCWLVGIPACFWSFGLFALGCLMGPCQMNHGTNCQLWQLHTCALGAGAESLANVLTSMHDCYRAGLNWKSNH